ncbi:MAG: hypothetical protein NT062_32595 [Proteobacteria bacterium]|nr:hypothetical protein [Pseudomonadota bacterium]
MAGCRDGSGACGTSKAPVDESFEDLAGLDSKSDYFSYRLKMVGTVADGASMAVPYTKTPRFRGVIIAGSAGDSVDIWVRSTDGGDALAWLLDDRYKVIAKNDDADDADGTTTDSHLQVVLPASTSGTYKVVFRDYDVAKHTFTVSYARTAVAQPQAPDSGNNATVHAFLPIYQAAGQTFATDGHVVAAATMPVGARSGFSDFEGSASTPADVVAWKFKVGTANAYAVMLLQDSGYWVSLFNSTGHWVAHGHVNAFPTDPTIDWNLDIDDPTICRCGLAPDGSGYAGCAWVDGNNYVSDISDCD